jgi:hypothetical protein
LKAVKLTNSEAVVLVSDEDFERVNQYRWFLKRAKSPPGQGDNAYYYAARSVYAGRKPDGRQITKTVWLHRFLADVDSGEDVHHKDGDKLNCQRDNIEPIGHAEHGRKYRGAEVINDDIPF